MVQAAHDRGFTPEAVAFDSWYSGLENLKAIRGYGWRWLTRLKANRNVNLDRQGLGPVQRDGDRLGWHGGPSGGLRVDPGLQDRLSRQGH
jgi:hypothetical protein